MGDGIGCTPSPCPPRWERAAPRTAPAPWSPKRIALRRTDCGSAEGSLAIPAIHACHVTRPAAGRRDVHDGDDYYCCTHGGDPECGWECVEPRCETAGLSEPDGPKSPREVGYDPRALPLSVWGCRDRYKLRLY
jgi:hypothetical protein